MPSPVGHALGGLTLGWLVAGRRSFRLKPEATYAFAILGMLPDIDFLFGAHSTYTHSIGAAGIVGLAAWLCTRLKPRPTSNARPTRDARPASGVVIGIAAAAAYGSHILFDWMGRDGTSPIGIMALWPVSDAFYLSDLRVFMAIDRRYWRDGFWLHNALAVARELLILLPIAVLVWWTRVRSRNQSA